MDNGVSVKDPTAGMTERQKRAYWDERFGIDRRLTNKKTLLEVLATKPSQPVVQGLDALQRAMLQQPALNSYQDPMLGPAYNPLQLKPSNVIYAPAGRPPVIYVPPGGFGGR